VPFHIPKFGNGSIASGPISEYGVGDGVQRIIKLLAEDEMSLDITEVTDELLSILTRADSIGISVADIETLYSSLSRSDNLVVDIIEINSILSTLLWNDNLTLGITEGLVEIISVLRRADNLNITVLDNLVLLVLLLRSDAVNINTNDITSILSVISTSDTLLPVFQNIGNIIVNVRSNDAIVIGFVDETVFDKYTVPDNTGDYNTWTLTKESSDTWASTEDNAWIITAGNSVWTTKI
jgi:hypothetical protein